MGTKLEDETIKVKKYYSDISGKEIKDFVSQFNQCTKCNGLMNDEEQGQIEDDGTLCKICFEKGFRIKYGVEGGVGVIDITKHSSEVVIDTCEIAEVFRKYYDDTEHNTSYGCSTTLNSIVKDFVELMKLKDCEFNEELFWKQVKGE